jgi:hypothetical protein
MTWFTRYSRPARKDLPPGGRNHIKTSPTRTLCGIRLQPWILNRPLVMDVASQERAYPDCANCRRLYAKRLEVSARSSFRPAAPLAA